MSSFLPSDPKIETAVRECAKKIVVARERNASVILMYGAHLVKNGAHRIVNALLAKNWITHLATNGAGTIHDWELAHLGRTERDQTERVVEKMRPDIGEKNEAGGHPQGPTPGTGEPLREQSRFPGAPCDGATPGAIQDSP